jgi:hypothetical protein
LNKKHPYHTTIEEAMSGTLPLTPFLPPFIKTKNTVMNTKEIHKELIGPNIFALYENGEFQTTKHLRDGWLMLIDIGRHRHTIVNIETTEAPIALTQQWGQLWRDHDAKYTGTMLVVDDKFRVHQSIVAKEQDYINVKNGTFGGIMEMTERFYMLRDGKFENMLR